MSTACYLEPVDAVRVFTRLSRYTRSTFQSSVDPGKTWNASLFIATDSFDSLRTQLSTNRRQLLSALYVGLRVNPESILNLTAANGDSLVHLLCRKGEASILRMFVSHALIDVNRLGAGDMTLLHCSAFAKNTELCKMLINRGADPGIKDSIGRLPEDWATVQGAHELCTFLRHCRKGKHENPISNGCFSWLSTS